MKKAIGILGGMGPEASGYLYKILIEKAVTDFDAKNNDDFPEILLLSVPVPDFISSDTQKGKALKMLKERVKQLNQMDLACLSIACNTAHTLIDDLQSASKIPFISMIEEVASRVKKDKIKKVGLLATPSTLRFRLYQERLSKEEIETVVSNSEQMKLIENVIRNVIAAKTTKKDTRILQKIAQNLVKQGAEAIILGCTELPLAFPLKFKKPVYNSVQILAEALLHKYYQQNTMESQ